MLSRERVKRALNHEEPDRIPIDFGMGPASGAVGIAHNKLLQYFGYDDVTKIWHPYLSWAETDLRLLEKFNVDFIKIAGPIEEWRKEVYPDGNEYDLPAIFNTKVLEDGSRVNIYNDVEVAKRPADGYWYDPIYNPLKNATIDDLKNFSWMPPFSFYSLIDKNVVKEMVKGLSDIATKWLKESDLALVGWFGGTFFEPAQGLRGLEQFYIDLYENLDFLEALFDKLLDSNLEYAKHYIDAVGDKVQVIVVGGEDIGAQGNLQIDPAIYRKLVKPRQKELWQYFKSNSDAKLLVHCCGYIEPILEDFIDAGIDIINPVQIGAGMDMNKLKNEYGSRLTFWGGACNTQTTLPHGSVEDVKSEVEERIRVFAPGGGYVFSAEQTIQADVPVENIITLYQSALKYGKYPIKNEKQGLTCN